MFEAFGHEGRTTRMWGKFETFVGRKNHFNIHAGDVINVNVGPLLTESRIDRMGFSQPSLKAFDFGLTKGLLKNSVNHLCKGPVD